MTLRTIYELMGIFLALLALFVFLIQLSMPDIRGTRWVTLCFLSGAASVGLIMLRGYAPLFFTEILSGILALMVNVFVYWGFAELMRLGRPVWIFWLTVPATVSFVAWFTYIHSAILPRIFAYNTATLIQHLFIAILLFRNGTPESRLPRYTLACSYLCWATYRFTDIFSLIGSHGITIYQPLSTPVTSPIPVALIIASLLTGNGYVWLAMTYLHTDLKLQSTTDSLTGLFNRRAIEKAAIREIMLARRKKLPVSLILLDLDHFKSINDDYGHEVGDTVLCHTARCLCDNLRNIDVIGRIGGEEFVALLPDTSTSTAHKIAERLCRSISDVRVPGLSKQLCFTASLGVSTFSILDSTWEEMLHRADQAMYAAKRNGRNCVEVVNLG